MASTSKCNTSEESTETPAYKKFRYKPPGSRPFATEISDETPMISTEFGPSSRETPCKSNIPSSFESSIGDDVEDNESVVFRRPEAPTGSIQRDSESLYAAKSKRPLSSGSGQSLPRWTNRNQLPQQDISDFRKETPLIYTTSKQPIEKGVGKKLNFGRNNGSFAQGSTTTDPVNTVSSSYFSKSKKKGRGTGRQQGLSSSTVSRSLSESTDLDGSVAMETEGDISAEDVGPIRNTEFSMSTDNQVRTFLLISEPFPKFFTLFMSPQPKGWGHIVFGADLVGVGVHVASFPCFIF